LVRWNQRDIDRIVKEVYTDYSVRRSDLKLQIFGQVEGYDVVIELGPDDIADDPASEIGPTGIIQRAVAAVNEHGIIPAKRTPANNTSTTREPVSSDWECPVHKKQNVGEGKFGIQCLYSEKTDYADDPAPRWANKDEAFKTRSGDYMFYCKHRPERAGGNRR
jgi:hypothetical protein